MFRRKNSGVMFLTHVSPASIIDGSACSRRNRMSRNCAQTAGLPPANLKKKALRRLTWQVVNCLGTGKQAQSLYDDVCMSVKGRFWCYSGF
jgi:hypothetical protein